MAINLEDLGKLLNPAHHAWAEFQGATLHHRMGWTLFVQEVRFRPPYCTLITRLVNDEEKELHFNTEAFARGAFVAVHLVEERAQIVQLALTAVVEEERKTEEQRQRTVAERKVQTARDTAQRAARERAAELEALAGVEAMRGAEERVRRDAEAARARRVEEWHKCIAARRITRLAHATRLPNLQSILKYGLWPVTCFGELASQPIRNDEERYDRRLDTVSLSITHPNDSLFCKWHAYKYAADTWVVLSIDPAVLWELPCSIFFANAASRSGRTAVTDTETLMVADFEKLFGEPSNGATRAQLGHAPCDTTNPQSEVMIRGKIEPTYLQAISVRDAIDLAKVHSVMGSDKLERPVNIERCLFDIRRCASEFVRVQRAHQEGSSGGSAPRSDDLDDDIPF